MSRVAPCIICLWLTTGCGQERDGEPEPYDLDFDIPRSESFAASFSAYELYQEPLASLQPAERAIPYELSSELFTDYAHKQRLLMVPEGPSRVVRARTWTSIALIATTPMGGTRHPDEMSTSGKQHR